MSPEITQHGIILAQHRTILGKLAQQDTILKRRQVASEAEAALHNYLWRLLTPEQRVRLPRGVSGQSFFESVRIYKRRLLRGLVLHPDDAMCFNIWNDHLKVQWEGILDAINARKKQYGVQ
ncbi:hypothetical protein ARMSODRAFT_1015922 [Armillaria solidipes]|uniref:Uncharacterized protein n=1 Tax=Armillaria solidipes TaxID=1076256 RepID=A0A2H3C8K7_9AGAR|nr:hypothetical protein ARMSODRAFT_1015922 [Armillaria solidipes]